MIGSFDLGQGGIFLALTRGIFVVSLFVSYGAMLFRSRLALPSLKVMAPAEAAAMTRRYRRLGISGLCATLVLLFVWLVVESGTMAQMQGLIPALKTVPIVLAQTLFGHVVMLQVAALIAALAILTLRKPITETFAFSAFFAGLAVMLHAWHGHAAAMYEGMSPLLLCEILHLLAGSAWLGSLVPLLIMVCHAPPNAAEIAAKRYAGFGTRCVLVLVASAACQGYVLIGSIAALTGSAYGFLALIKMSLLLILLVFAAVNRFWLTPRGLLKSIIVETFIGLMVVLTASTLVMLPPGMHM